MSSPKWSSKSKKYNPNRTFVMSAESSPSRKFNPKSTFLPGNGLTPTTLTAANPATAAAPRAEMFGGASSPPMSLSGVGVPPGSTQMPPAIGDQVGSLSLYHPPIETMEHLTYAPTPFRAHLAPPIEPHERRADDFSTPSELKEELRQRNLAALEHFEMSKAEFHVNNYHSLMRIDRSHNVSYGRTDEDVFFSKNAAKIASNDEKPPSDDGNPANEQSSPSLSAAQSGPNSGEREMPGSRKDRVQRYKSVSHSTARTYFSSRISDFESLAEHENPSQIVNKWKRVQNSAVVGVVEAFTSLAFDPKKASLVVIYEYFPRTMPLRDFAEENYADLKPASLWSISVQLMGALRAIHERGLACRGVMNEKYVQIQPSTDSRSFGRVRIGISGVPDISHGVLSGDDLAEAQKQDFRDLSAMSRRLCARSLGFPPELEMSRKKPPYTWGPELRELIYRETARQGEETPGLDESKFMPPDFVEFVAALDAAEPAKATELLVPHSFQSLDATTRRGDDLEEVSALELENGRLFRSLAKLEFASEGTSSDALSKTYVLHSFKRFVFGQLTEQGKPALNYAHASATSNKLDAGTTEKVSLVSPDEKTRMIVSYSESKSMFETEFDEKVKAT